MYMTQAFQCNLMLAVVLEYIIMCRVVILLELLTLKFLTKLSGVSVPLPTLIPAVDQITIYTSYDLLLISLQSYYHLTDWVIQLGPPTYEGNFYQYAVVTDSSDISLFVLARNVTEFKVNYEVEVLSKLESQGFTKFYNRPRDIYQGDDCVYIQQLNGLPVS